MATEPHDPIADEPREGLREFVATWLPAILAVIFIRLFIFEPFRIPSGSMVPTLLIGDHVLVTKFSYGVWMPFKSMGVPFTTIGLEEMGMGMENVELVDLGDPQRGDVIVFHYPREEDITYIKRVVGVPGDRIRVVDNQVFLNGEPQDRASLVDFADVDQACRVRPADEWTETLSRLDGSSLPHPILTQQGRPSPLANPPGEFVVPDEAVFVMGDNRDHSEDSRRWGFVRHNQIKGKAHFVWLSWDSCSGGIGSLRVERMFRSLYGSAGGSSDAMASEP